MNAALMLLLATFCDAQIEPEPGSGSEPSA